MARRSFSKPNTPPQEPLINITPLIDVVFVILIAFILIAPLLEQDGVRLAQGECDAKHKSHVQMASSIQIHVFADNSVALNRKKMGLQELTRALKIAKQEHPKAKLQLFHDKKANFGTYQEVKNRVEAAGFEEMDVVLSPADTTL